MRMTCMNIRMASINRCMYFCVYVRTCTCSYGTMITHIHAVGMCNTPSCINSHARIRTHTHRTHTHRTILIYLHTPLHTHAHTCTRAHRCTCVCMVYRQQSSYSRRHAHAGTHTFGCGCAPAGVCAARACADDIQLMISTPI